MRAWLSFLLASVLACFPIAAQEIFPQLGHGGWVSAAAFSEDGRRLLSGGWGGQVKLWDVPTGREIRTLVGHRTNVDALVFSPDGQRAASSGLDKTLRFWDLSEGRCLATLPWDGWGCKLAFVDGGRSLLAWDSETVKLYDTATWKERSPGLKAPVGGWINVQTGGTLALRHTPATVGPSVLELWDLGTGQIRQTLKRYLSYHAVITPAGQVLSMKFENQAMEFWDPITGQVLWSALGHTKHLDRLFLAPSAPLALSASKGDGTMRWWSLKEGRCLATLAMPPGFLPQQLSPDGQRVLLMDDVGMNRNYKVMDLRSGQEVLSRSRKADQCEGMVLASAARTLILGVGGLALWDETQSRELQAFKGRAQVLSRVAISPDRSLAAMATGRDVSVWDLALGRRRALLAGDQSLLAALVIAPDGRTLATGTLEGTVRLWDLATGKERWVQKAHVGSLHALAFAPDGRLLASGGNDGKVRLWESSQGNPSGILEGHASGNEPFAGVCTLAFNAEGTELLSGGGDATLRRWNPKTQQEVGKLADQGRGVLSAVYRADGHRILWGCRDGSVRLWSPSSGEEPKVLARMEGGVTCVAFASDGQRVMVRPSDEAVHLLDGVTGQEVRAFQGIRQYLTLTHILANFGLSSDGQTLVTTDSPGVVARLWDTASGRELGRFMAFEGGEWVIITPEGYFNASQGGAAHLNVRTGASVSGVDQFYTRHFRPELVSLALAGGTLPSGGDMGQIARQRPAPELRILTPSPGTLLEAPQVTLTLLVKDLGGGVGDVRVYANGSQVANDARGLSVIGKETPQGRTLSFTIPLAEGLNELRVAATNQDRSMESAPAQVTVRARTSVAVRPDLYALVVGINMYRNQSIALKYAVSDAEAFAQALREKAGRLYGQVHVQVLTTPETTTRGSLTQAFEQLRAKVRPQDVFVFYNASHGLVDVVEGEEQYYLLTSNVLLLSSRHIGVEALSQRQLTGLIGSIPAQKKLVVLDTCQAGRGGREIQASLLQQTRGLTDATAVKLLQRAIGSAVFSASSDTQAALEGYQGHGLFTHVLLEGLRGKADLRKDGFVTILGLAEYVEERVSTLSEEVFKRQQTPVIETGVNFPLAQWK